MQIRITQDAPLGVRTEALVVPIFEDTALEGLSKDVDAAAGGAISEALASGEIKGKLGETVLAYAKEQPFRRVLAIGLGESAKLENSLLARYAAIAVRHLGRRNLKAIAIALPARVRGSEVAAASFVA
jgi:leucyl aminopeptidase